MTQARSNTDESRQRLTGMALPALAVAVIFLAAAIITPAIGGPSVKKLAKKVSKALELAEEADKKAQQALEQSGKPGPEGQPGQAGTQGAQGPPALKLDYDQSENDAQLRTVGTQNELTVKALCYKDAGAAGLDVYLHSSLAATVNMTLSSDNGSPPAAVDNESLALVSGTDTFMTGMAATSGFSRIEVQAIYRNANRVISLDLHTIADEDTDSCQVQGTAVPAS